MKELVVLSGKGGTGKTSLTACLARLAGSSLLVDADVDASNLPILLNPQPKHREEFFSGETAVVDPERCVGCGTCAKDCRTGSLHPHEKGANACFQVDPTSCSGCGLCLSLCPHGAIRLVPRLAGEWRLSQTPFGPLLHAELRPGSGHSGKLVAFLKSSGRKLAESLGIERLLVDGPPGTGCPAHATLSGADRLLLVAEPGLSGIHDAERVMDLADRFGVAVALCVNKWDLDPEGTSRLERLARENGALFVGKIRYDLAFKTALRQGKDLLAAAPQSGGADDLRALWQSLEPFV